MNFRCRVVNLTHITSRPSHLVLSVGHYMIFVFDLDRLSLMEYVIWEWYQNISKYIGNIPRHDVRIHHVSK